MLACIAVVASFIMANGGVKPDSEQSPSGMVVLSVQNKAGIANLLIISPSLELLKPSFHPKTEKCSYENETLYFLKDSVDLTTKT